MKIYDHIIPDYSPYKAEFRNSIVLKIYDFFSVSKLVSKLGVIEACHVSIVVHGTEVTYCDENPKARLDGGVNTENPSLGLKLREIRYLGEASMPLALWRTFLKEIRTQWRGCNYSLLENNCMTFCNYVALCSSSNAFGLPPRFTWAASKIRDGISKPESVVALYKQLRRDWRGARHEGNSPRGVRHSAPYRINQGTTNASSNTFSVSSRKSNFAPPPLPTKNKMNEEEDLSLTSSLNYQSSSISLVADFFFSQCSSHSIATPANSNIINNEIIVLPPPPSAGLPRYYSPPNYEFPLSKNGESNKIKNKRDIPRPTTSTSASHNIQELEFSDSTSNSNLTSESVYNDHSSFFKDVPPNEHSYYQDIYLAGDKGLPSYLPINIRMNSNNSPDQPSSNHPDMENDDDDIQEDLILTKFVQGYDPILPHITIHTPKSSMAQRIGNRRVAARHSSPRSSNSSSKQHHRFNRHYSFNCNGHQVTHLAGNQLSSGRNVMMSHSSTQNNNNDSNPTEGKGRRSAIPQRSVKSGTDSNNAGPRSGFSARLFGDDFVGDIDIPLPSASPSVSPPSDHHPLTHSKHTTAKNSNGQDFDSPLTQVLKGMPLRGS